jgi:hypothetical protein
MTATVTGTGTATGTATAGRVTESLLRYSRRTSVTRIVPRLIFEPRSCCRVTLEQRRTSQIVFLYSHRCSRRTSVTRIVPRLIFEPRSCCRVTLEQRRTSQIVFLYSHRCSRRSCYCDITFRKVIVELLSMSNNRARLVSELRLLLES